MEFSVKQPLYDSEMAKALMDRELARGKQDNEKFELLAWLIGKCDSVLDIGCGSGLLLKRLEGQVNRTVGLDESEERLRQAKDLCPSTEFTCKRIEDIDFQSEFDLIVASQVLHEVKLFGREDELMRSLARIKDALRPKGRFLLLDHLDPGEGECQIMVEEPSCAGLIAHFQLNFQYRTVRVRQEGDKLAMPKRDLQDFVTKVWSFGSPMEGMEMRETHCVFSEEEVKRLLETAGLLVTGFIEFQDIAADLEMQGLRLLFPSSWRRKFICIAETH